MIEREPGPRLVVTALGIVQILAWGSSFYFPAVLAVPIVEDTKWSLGWVVGGVSIGLLVAGLISPQVGRVIDSKGGRPVLLTSSILYAAGLTVIGLSPALPVYLLGWVVVGLGMGTGLYDAVFAALGRLYGSGARAPITNLTLFGGFASAVCWPLSAFLVEELGWRWTCFAYAGLHLVLALPLQAFAMRARPQRQASPVASHAPDTHPDAPAIPREWLVFVLLALVMTIAAGIGSILVVHLLNFLQAKGLTFAAAVSLGTLFGPAQVGARVVERIFGQHYHPIWTMAAATVLMFVGLLLLMHVSAPLLIAVVLLYGAGYGITWIARGTLPLALFGAKRFPVLMGRLAFPSLIVQALAPAAGALLIEANGADATVTMLSAFALVNVLLIALLWAACRGSVQEKSPSAPA